MAAATLNVRCGFVKFHKDSEVAHLGPSSLAISKRFNDRRSPTVSNMSDTFFETITNSRVATGGSLLPMSAVEKKGYNGERGRADAKMDEWMEKSVAEIVKNLREAPLLVHVYNGGETRTEKGVEEECWLEAMEKWKRREMPMPEGVIFVEQLDEEEEEEEERRKDDGLSRAWGIVVQGRGCECGPVCYLLKTSRGGGEGLCCTHFCLMRVQSFTESARSQLQNCWLN